MIAFDPNDTRLTAYALGELDAAERAEIDQLLADSAEARAELAEIQETVGLLQTQLAAEPIPELTAEQRQKLEQHIAAQATGAAAAIVHPDLRAAGVAAAPSPRAWLAVGGSLAATALALTVMLPAMQNARAPSRSNPAEVAATDSSESMTSPVDKLVALNESAAGASVLSSRAGRGDTEGLTRESIVDESGRPAVNRPVDAASSSVKQLAQSQSQEDRLGDASLVTRRRMASTESQSSARTNSTLGGVPVTSATTAPAAPSAESAGMRSAPAATAPGAGGKLASREKLDELRQKSDSSAPSAADRRDGPVALRGAAPAKDSGPADKTVEQLRKLNSKAEDQPVSGPPTRLSVVMERSEAKPQAGQPGSPLPERAKSQLEPKAKESKEGEAETRLLAELDRKKQEESKDRYFRALDSLQKGREAKFGAEKAPQADKLSTAESYEVVAENEFSVPVDAPLSTFSIDVDSASYANARRFLTQGQLPPPASVRVEEFINYFRYDYKQPTGNDAFSVTADVAPCPWQKENYLARVGLKAKDIDKAKRPPTNLVFLIDVSGSMQPANKLPLVKRGLTLLVEEMSEKDHIAIVTYAGDAGVKLPGTRGSDQLQIMQVIDGLHAGGSTNGASGIRLAYEQARQHFNKEGENRVILCTDGDFNVGISSDDELVKLIQSESNSGVFLSVFGFGMGNLKDSKLEKLADKGNGHYGYIDDLNEARKVFNEEMVGTLYTVAKDVKLQVEFNPVTVGAYRLIGYENRALAAQDFNDDTKDAGEIGAGHTVTALYEIVPAGQWPKSGKVDDLKYVAVKKKQAEDALAEAKSKLPAEVADDLFTVKLRYKQPNAEASVRTEDYVVDDIAGKKDVAPNRDLLWAASVANFAMHLKQSKHVGTWTLDDIAETAAGAKGDDPTGRKSEFVDMVKAAQRMKQQESR